MAKGECLRPSKTTGRRFGRFPQIVCARRYFNADSLLRKLPNFWIESPYARRRTKGGYNQTAAQDQNQRQTRRTITNTTREPTLRTNGTAAMRDEQHRTRTGPKENETTAERPKAAQPQPFSSHRPLQEALDGIDWAASPTRVQVIGARPLAASGREKKRPGWTRESKFRVVPLHAAVQRRNECVAHHSFLQMLMSMRRVRSKGSTAFKIRKKTTA